LIIGRLETVPNPLNDYRINFVQNLGVKIDFAYYKRCFGIFEKTAVKSPNSGLGKIVKKYLLKLYSVIVRQFYQNDLAGLNFIKKILTGYHNNAVCILDHGTSYVYEQISKILTNYGCMSVAVPHGLKLHEGFKDKEKNRILKSATSNSIFTLYDHCVFPNKISLLGYNLEKNKNLSIIGSVRFCSQWVKKLEEILPYEDSVFQSADKLKVLFVMEKTAVFIKEFGKELTLIDDFARRTLLTELSKLEFVDLVLKLDPSNERPEYVSKIPCKIIDNTIQTTSLISEADLVIGTVTSVLLDAIVREKRVIFPRHLSPFRSMFERFDVVNIVDRNEEIICLLINIFENSLSVPYGKGTEIMLKELVHPNCESDQVLGEYSKLLQRV